MKFSLMKCAVVAALSLAAVVAAKADEPYARSRDYDLQHSKIVLHFQLSERKVLGDVTHSLSILKEGTERVAFDSVGLAIESVTVNGKAAKFESGAENLSVPLGRAAHTGDKFQIEIRYEGKPKKGLYFVLPDKNYPGRPPQIWTQGESEDTRYYLPTYDYPNDRLTTEMIVTVPAAWLAVSNGKLVSVKDAGKGEKTWYWSETVPSSTYLIMLAAGEFDEVKEAWRGKPVTFYAPRGRGDRLIPTYGRTRAMLDFFSQKLGVVYPWEKYAQVMADDFVAGGMENSSATINTSSSLTPPALVKEYTVNQDDLISHELAHQWFGDLLTCKDWGDVWLNEGFATFFEMAWTEKQYGKEEADYERWTMMRHWWMEPDLFEKSIVRFDFNDSSIFDGNSYGKGGLVLYMLRQKLGEQAFYTGLQHYLEANRGKNVVTADFARAMEEATHVNIDAFLEQWVYGAGAPRFDVNAAYDAAKKEARLTVKQTQKQEGRVGLFRVPVEVEITTAEGAKTFPIVVEKEEETFTFPAKEEPLMVLLDKGGRVLKSAVFHKTSKEWAYQLKNASELSDRLDAAKELGKVKKDENVVAALGEALKTDKSWHLRAAAADALSEIGGTEAARKVLAALDEEKEPWMRSALAAALGNIKEDAEVAAKLEAVAAGDGSFRARTAAVGSLARLKTAKAYGTLEAAVKTESPDAIVRNAALRGFGKLGDDRAVPALLEWSAPGKDFETRQAAISSLGSLKKEDHAITKVLAGYLLEPYFPVRISAVFALGARGDAEAIAPLEALLHSGDLGIYFAPMIEQQIEKLKKPQGEKKEGKEAAGDSREILQRLEKIEREMRETNERLKAIEERLPAGRP